MRPVSHTVIDSVRAPIKRVFDVLTDPDRFREWLPGCSGVEPQGPMKRGTRLSVRFGERSTEFEVVDFAPPMAFGWTERGARQGSKMFFRLDASGDTTAVTVRQVWIPRSFVAGLRGRFFEKRQVQSQLDQILKSLKQLVTT